MASLGGLLSFVVGIGVLASSSAAFAYRPFVSTDAAVADPHEVEIELGYFILQRTNDEHTFIIPRAVINYSVFKNWELVAEFAMQRTPDAAPDVIRGPRRTCGSTPASAEGSRMRRPTGRSPWESRSALPRGPRPPQPLRPNCFARPARDLECDSAVSRRGEPAHRASRRPGRVPHFVRVPLTSRSANSVTESALVHSPTQPSAYVLSS